MRNVTVALLAGVGALFVGSANASDIYVGSDQPLIQQVRTVCDEDGRCYRTNGGRRVIIQRDSYNYYAPRERYIERRDYRDWDDGPRAGVGFRAPGVSVGVGAGDRW
jgi:hypothetical protein